MLKLNEAPNIVLDALKADKLKRGSRFFTGPAILVMTGSVTGGQWPKKIKGKEKYELQQLKNALKNLRHNKGFNDEETIRWQIVETLDLINQAVGNMYEHSSCLYKARKKIEEKLAAKGLSLNSFIKLSP